MKASRLLAFTVIVWLWATIPWLLIPIFQRGPIDDHGDPVIRFALVFGGIYTLVVMGILIIWSALRRRVRLPSPGIVLAVMYFLSILLLFINSAFDRVKDLALAMLFPLLMLRLPMIDHMTLWDVAGAIIIGTIFYVFLGKFFERWVFNLQPRASSLEP
jgi:hypothetical protein